MSEPFVPNPNWTPRERRVIDLSNLYYKIRKGFIDKKPFEVISGINEYENLKDKSIVNEYPILVNNESKIFELIRLHELNLVGRELVLN
jgi:hypothetical protein